MEKNDQKEKKNKALKKVIQIAIVILIIILLLKGCACEKKDKVIEATRKYITDKDIKVTEPRYIKIKDLVDEKYLDNFDNKCLENSQVKAYKDHNKIKYEIIIDCTKNEIEISLNGSKNIKLDIGEDYIEYGATAILNDSDISSRINIDLSKVNFNGIGMYEITYSIKVNDIEKKVIRQITITDSVAPLIVLNGNSTIEIVQNGKYTEYNATALDHYDGDITANIEINGEVDTSKIGTYILEYIIEDSSGNRSSITRKINVIEETPKVGQIAIIITGSNPYYMEYGETYKELGYTASDTIEGDVTSLVKVNNLIDLNKLGTYKVIYSYINSFGRVAEVVRTVIITDNKKPVIKLNNQATITVNQNTPYIEYGAIATDNYDKDLTNKIKINGTVDTSKIGVYYITYEVTDSSSNKTSIQRKVIVRDNTPPAINLEYSTKIIGTKDKYNLLDGITITDNHDSYIPLSSITISSIPNYDQNTPGEYEITYKVTDSSGNIGTATRIITVIKRELSLNKVYDFKVEQNGTETENMTINNLNPGDVINLSIKIENGGYKLGLVRSIINLNGPKTTVPLDKNNILIYKGYYPNNSYLLGETPLTLTDYSYKSIGKILNGNNDISGNITHVEGQDTIEYVYTIYLKKEATNEFQNKVLDIKLDVETILYDPYDIPSEWQ